MSRAAALPRAIADRGLPLALGATVLLFVCGSSAVGWARAIGDPGKRIGIAVLALAAAVAVREARTIVVPSRLAVRLAAIALIVAFTSTAWSPWPGHTLVQAAGFAAVLLTATASSGIRHRQSELLTALVAAGASVAALGALLYVVDRDAAVLGAEISSVGRYRGLGENPNTVPLLLSLVTPLALWQLGTANASWPRRAAVGAWLLCTASIIVSDSRGALLAAALGSMLVATLGFAGRMRIAVVTTVVVVFGAGLLASRAQVFVIDPISASAPPTQSARLAPGKRAITAVASARAPATEQHLAPDVFLEGYPDRELVGPSHRRTVLDSSGRAKAWQGALEQASERPVLGYGFGTEPRVFLDRYYVFQGNRVESSYIGLMMQLGVVGLAVFAAIVALALTTALRAIRRRPDERLLFAALAGAILAGAVVAAFQSYLYAPGNLAMLPFWLVTALALAASGRTVSKVVAPRWSWPAAVVVVAALAVTIGVLEGATAANRLATKTEAVWQRVGGRLDSASLTDFYVYARRRCLRYRRGERRMGAQLCFDPRGRLLETAERRRDGSLRFVDLLWRPEAAIVEVDSKALDRTIERLPR